MFMSKIDTFIYTFLQALQVYFFLQKKDLST